MGDMYNILASHPDKCTGCGLCRLACGMAKAGEFCPGQSRVRQASLTEQAFFGAFVCRQCVAPVCLEVCPVGAIERDASSGIVALDSRRCVSCGLCTLVCGYAGVFLSPLDGKAVKCDLCGGDPACARQCPTGALELLNTSTAYAYLENREDLITPGTSACLGCIAELGLRTTLRVLGPNTIVAIPPGCLGGVGVVGYGMTTGAKVPVFFPLLDNTASMLSGIKRHYRREGLDVHVVAFAGDGGTADVGFQCLSGAAERGENIIYICYDNEGYMNTGIQRSSTTPYKAWTTTTPVGSVSRGKKQLAKDMPLIMAMHGIPYVATATVAYLEDYLAKLKKAMMVKDGLAYIHLFSPCPTGWRFPSDKTVDIARLAVETNFFPLWEAEHGRISLTKEVEFPRPVETYLRQAGKYGHLDRADIEEMQAIVNDKYQKLLGLARL